MCHTGPNLEEAKFYVSIWFIAQMYSWMAEESADSVAGTLRPWRTEGTFSQRGLDNEENIWEVNEGRFIK